MEYKRREVSYEQGNQIKEDNRFEIFMETSAKDGSNVNKLFEYFEPYLNGTKTCRNKLGLGGCFAESYSNLQGNLTNLFVGQSYASVVLKDGISVGFYTWGNNSCKGGSYCSTVAIDINGPNLPNKFGIDFFMYLYPILRLKQTI